MAATPPTNLVRNVDPNELLLYGGPGAIYPYVPRDVDPELDEALATPGAVLVAFEDSSGARRSTYEALLRNLPDAALLVNSYPDARMADAGQLVAWIDHTGFIDAEAWTSWLQASDQRWLIMLIGNDELGTGETRTLIKPLQPRIVRISSRPEMAQDVGETGIPTDRAHLADYRADTEEGIDRLGITTDVRMLADLVASRLIEPPLSIGLFGNWGSGKSFFMRQMLDRVRVLADSARAAEERTGLRGKSVSSYCSSVRQITFNAWHYTEANLWASLATHIFDNLAATGSDDDLRRRADDLAAIRAEQKSLLKQLSTVRLERILVAAELDRQPKPAWAALHSLTADDLTWIATELGVAKPTAEDVQRFAGQTRELVKDSARLLRHDPVPAFVLVVGVLITLGLSWLIGWTGWSGLAGLGAIVASLGTAVGRAKAAVSRIRAVADRIKDPLAKRLSELDKEATRLEQAIADLAPQHDIAAFASVRAGEKNYRQHLGVVSLLRRDLETFAAMLERERSEGAAGIERIVLYVDDLDRCPPKVVIQVLEAIHLLLALPVFVVVVGVDARWLTRAIGQHYTQLDGSADTFAANYLEKIFQVPFMLSAMDEQGFVRLIGGLTETDGDDVAIPQPGDNQESEQTDEPTPTQETPPVTTAAPSTQDVRPRRLAISQRERDFLSSLAPLMFSPRATKRLVNLYRLLRARLSGSNLDAFLEQGSYRAVLLLLAVLAGQPSAAPELFQAIRDTPTDAGWSAVVDKLESDTAIKRILTEITENALYKPTDYVGLYQEWLPLVSRFSFASR